MPPAKVLQLIRPFDPLTADAEAEYDAVVRRVNGLRDRRSEVARDLAELERQIVENDLVVESGPRYGEPLTPSERHGHLLRLLDLSMELRRLNDEEPFAVANLYRMNEALDRWARETYGA
jgi:hypothetical protein